MTDKKKDSFIKPVARRILLCSEVVSAVKSLCSVLSWNGYDTHVSSREKLIRRILQLRPQFIVLDETIDILDATDLCRTLKRNERTSQSYLVILLDNPSIASVERCYDAGADLCLVKPFRPGFFLEKLEWISGFDVTRKALETV